jgi:hypothetical protein
MIFFCLILDLYMLANKTMPLFAWNLVWFGLHVARFKIECFLCSSFVLCLIRFIQEILSFYVFFMFNLFWFCFFIFRFFSGQLSQVKTGPNNLRPCLVCHIFVRKRIFGLRRCLTNTPLSLESFSKEKNKSRQTWPYKTIKIKITQKIII